MRRPSKAHINLGLLPGWWRTVSGHTHPTPLTRSSWQQVGHGSNGQHEPATVRESLSKLVDQCCFAIRAGPWRFVEEAPLQYAELHVMPLLGTVRCQKALSMLKSQLGVPRICEECCWFP